MKKHRFYTIVIVISFVFLLISLCLSRFTNLANAQMRPSNQPSSTPTAVPTNPPFNDQTLLILSIAIAIIVMAILAIVFYIIYSRKQGHDRSKEKNPTYFVRCPDSTTQAPNVVSKDIRPFEVFLCYKKSSGRDYADHLKYGLEEVGLHTFEDCKDIPQTVTTEEGWDKFRDQAIAESRYFVLIMTHGFELSSEVVKEIGIARKQANKTFVFFRHRSMGRKIVVNLGDEVFDIGRLEQVSFESKEELLRLAINILKKGVA